MADNNDVMQAILSKLDVLDARLNQMEEKKKKKPRSEEFCQLKSKQMKQYHASMRAFREEAKALRESQEKAAAKENRNMRSPYQSLPYPMHETFNLDRHVSNLGFGGF